MAISGDGAAKQQRSKIRTQWAAQFAVASELCKRGYEVGFTMGNTTPDADLMVRSPEGRTFLIDVKGLYKKNDWWVQEKREHPGLYYVFALVPDDQPNRFFVMTQAQVNAAIKKFMDAKRARKADFKFRGFHFGAVEDYDGRWATLPQ